MGDEGYGVGEARKKKGRKKINGEVYDSLTFLSF
jgi:hypothetical protein